MFIVKHSMQTTCAKMCNCRIVDLHAKNTTVQTAPTSATHCNSVCKVQWRVEKGFEAWGALGRRKSLGKWNYSEHPFVPELISTSTVQSWLWLMDKNIQGNQKSRKATEVFFHFCISQLRKPLDLWKPGGESRKGATKTHVNAKHSFCLYQFLKFIIFLTIYDIYRKVMARVVKKCKWCIWPRKGLRLWLVRVGLLVWGLGGPRS